MLGVLGHAAIDLIIRGGKKSKFPGGPPTYCSFYLSQVGIEVIPISVVGNDFEIYINDYMNRGVDVSGIVIDSACKTTSYEITYMDNGRRRLRLLSRCRDITIGDIKSLPRTTVINPIAREVKPELLMYVRDNADFLGIDVQGFTRDFDGDGFVISRATTRDLAPLVGIADVIKVSVDDLSHLGMEDLLRFRGKFIVVSRGPGGSILIHDGVAYDLRVDGLVSAVDPTGAGDVLTCSLTYLLSRGEDPLWSFAYANALSLLKTLGEGPYGVVDREMLDRLVDTLLSRIKLT
ncbi:PfkB family carbohydrate kinase [Vulcanisaeta thermophila]|uniref:PfkB family carbohydrate kinase n=1 Tax=Vulcanisaeta thermophila TaxID=867917 RepID=UPI000852DFFB|nr:PfkB family carbohydrate kinase [Vulcanisaeta thermophila]